NLTFGVTHWTSYTADGIPPSVTAISPIMQSQWLKNGSTIDLNASITDIGSGMKNASVNVSSLNATGVAELDFDRSFWTNNSFIVATSNQGVFNLTITAYDNVSNVNNTINMTVYVDLTAPVLTNLHTDYATGQEKAKFGDYVTINITAKDMGGLSGLNLSSVMVNLSLVNDTYGFTQMNSAGGDDWTYTVLVNNSSTSIVYLPVRASDNVTNLNDTMTIPVILDNTPPAQITGLSAVDTLSDSGGSITLTWNASTELDFKNYLIYRNNAQITNVSGMTPIYSISVNSTYSWSDTSATTGTTFYYAVTANDTAGNENKSVINVSAVSVDNRVPSSSGGGGSGGAAAIEPYANVALKDVVSVYVSIDKNIKYEFKEDESPIDFVFFDSKKNSGYIAATVEVLKNRSSLVSSNPKGEVYKYMNIWVGKGGFATDANIANPVIEFKIAKSWISENGIDGSTIKLNRYNSDKWSSLPTTKISENNSYIYFRSESPGFSPFAITGDKKSTMVVKGSAPIIEKVETPIVETVEEPIVETVDESLEDDETKFSNLTIVLIIVLIGISIIVFLIILKRKHNTLKREQRLLKERQNIKLNK
ncbi:MAG: PGF-pre-PGF domain-containing protein, partial [Methanosarcinaceae archaeon]|nr:PGF-pre-PGF domain-containing protein [Methanosarcinaceae archaeon]